MQAFYKTDIKVWGIRVGLVKIKYDGISDNNIQQQSYLQS